MELLLQDKGDGGEFSLNGADIKTDDTFYTAVYLSLFNGDCFYNIYSEYISGNDFEESLNLPVALENLKKVETAASNALKWMLDQGVAKTIDVFAYGDSQEKINVEITITEPDGNSCQYAITWQNEKAALRRN